MGWYVLFVSAGNVGVFGTSIYLVRDKCVALRTLTIFCSLSHITGKKDNVEAAQKVYFARAQANSLAVLGKYEGEAAAGAAAESLFQKGYTY